MFYFNLLITFVASVSVCANPTVTRADNPKFIIRSGEPEFVLDAIQHNVQLQTFNSSQTQFWRMDPADDERFFIINIGNGLVLDIDGNPRNGANTITSIKTDGKQTQQWFINSDNTIVSAADYDYAMDVRGSEHTFSPGADIITFTKHGQKNQKFYFDFNITTN